MSYNILKKNVRFSGGDDGTIEGMVDITSDQVISGSKNFEFLTGSNVLVTGSLVVDGELSATSIISHVGDSNTKIQFGEDAVFITAGGVSVGNFYDNGVYAGPKLQLGGNSNFFVPGTGKVGIGTSVLVAPEHELVVTGTIAAAGQITCSLGITASAFHGDGSGLSNLGEASSVAASNIVGSVVATQVSHSLPLTSSGDNLTLKLASEGAISNENGLTINLGQLSTEAPYNDASRLLVSASGGGNQYITMQGLLNASNIGVGTLSNARLPGVIDKGILSASVGLSASSAQFGNISSSLVPHSGNFHYLGSEDKRWETVFVGSIDSSFLSSLTYANTIAHTFGTGWSPADATNAAARGTSILATGSVEISGTLEVENSITASSYAIAGGTIVDENADTNFGQLTFFVTSSADTTTPADNKKATFYVDEAANKFFVFVKYSDGTQKSGSIDLL